jgi:hypothetical protein
VVIVDRAGSIPWLLPADFLSTGKSVAGESRFQAARYAKDVQVVPVSSPESETESWVYLVASVAHNGDSTGAHNGGIDDIVVGVLAPTRARRAMC